jgi:N-methylhydantoinase A
MGGTSLDACVIENGNPSVEYEASLGNLRMMIPVYDIRTTGAGGGSIAWLDGEILRVGPKSAGANPGPICYGRGGEEPTLTDTAVALGYIDPQQFLGGEVELAEEETREGIREQLAAPLDSTVTQVSKGVFDVTLANTVGTIREITVEKGLDPRDFSMVGYGGAGPMFVPLLARELDANKVVIPQAPSVFSAYGMQMTDVIYDFSQTRLVPLQSMDLRDLGSSFTGLEEEAHTTLSDEGFDQSSRRTKRSVEMRYLGQEHTVRVPADNVESIDDITARFTEHHERRYGHAMDDPVEAVHLRVRGIGRTEKPEISKLDQGGYEDDSATTQDAYCFAKEEVVGFNVYRRERLEPGDTLQGPAIVREDTTTTVFHSDQEATVDDYGHLIITGGDR